MAWAARHLALAGALALSATAGAGAAAACVGGGSNGTCAMPAAADGESAALLQIRLGQQGALVRVLGDTNDVAIDELNNMGNSIRFLNWNFGPRRDGNGDAVLDEFGNPVMLDYSTFGAGVFAGLSTVGMVAQLIAGGGDDWGSIVLTGAKSFVPLVGMINPAVGLGVGILLSLFSVSSTSQAEALQALYEKIMQEVQSMINDALVQQNLATAYLTTSSLLLAWNQNPWYITHTPNSTSETTAYYNWYVESARDFDTSLKDMFSVDCMQETTLEPQFPPTELCQGFCASGVLLQQIQYAQAHIFTFQAAAQVSPNMVVAQQQSTNSNNMAKLYARLLAASLTNWMDYADTMTCKYENPPNWGESGHAARSGVPYSKCSVCTTTLSDEAQGVYRYTGKTVMDTFACAPSCLGGTFNEQPDDVCTAESGFDCPSPCQGTHFASMLTDWKASAQPQLMSMVRAFQLQFTSTEMANAKACACPAPQYLMMESNASTCQFLCRADVNCQSYQWTLEGEAQEGALVLNYSSPVNGTCRLFSCGWYLQRGAPCETSASCPSGTTCRVGDKRCLANADCDSSTTDCTAIPRTDTVDNWGGCINSDQCNDLTNFCHVGDQRCLSQADCDWAASTDGVARDCTPMPKTVRWNFTSVGFQYCVNTTSSFNFADVTDLDACKANCGNSCNAFALGSAGCTVYENCAASVLWRSDGQTTYMKDLSFSATAADASSACTFVHYNEG